MNDFIYQNVCGAWDLINTHPIITEIYPEFKLLSWKDCYFALNVQRLNEVSIPTNRYKKIIISYHTEYFDHKILWNFFSQNQDVEFLFLCDQYSEDIWPNNVTVLPWVTWGYQLDIAIQHFGLADRAHRIVNKKISSLSARHEFHKAAITAFLIEKCTDNELILSWHNNIWGHPYYQEENYFIPSTIKKYLLGKFASLPSIKLDSFENNPINNANWHHPAYLDVAVNFTNESVFNSEAMINDHLVRLPTPYVTEKTWKPLLAGCAFIPVGQFQTLAALTKVGFVFNYNIDLSFDNQIGDFDRLLKIYDLIETLLEMSPENLYKQTYDSCNFNLEHIKSGNLTRICNRNNLQTFEERISKW
jgi:hypothetical protein